MRAIGKHTRCTLVLERIGRLDQGTRRVDDVIHDHAGTPLYIADDVHHLGYVCFGAPLVDDGQVRLQPLGNRPRPHHPAHVRRHHEQILVLMLPDVAQQDRRCIDVIHRHVEKALDLVCMQIHGQHPVHAHSLQQIGHHLG